MSDREALLAAIRLHPDEDTPRLVFADWLDEHGESERAALIRYSCSPAFANRRTVEYRRAKRAAEACFPWFWTILFAPRDRDDFEDDSGERFDFILGANPERRSVRLLFEKGLVTEVRCTVRQWVEDVAERLSGAHAVSRVRFTTWDDRRGYERHQWLCQKWPGITFDLPPAEMFYNDPVGIPAAVPPAE